MIRIWIIVVCVSISQLLKAQDADPALWVQAGVEFNLPKKLTLELSEQVRYNMETADAYSLYSEIAAGYKINKHLQTALEYRLNPLPGNTSQRVAATASYKNNIGDFDWSIKTKVQYDIKPDKYESSAWRNKIGLKYDGLKSVKPYVSYEVFYSFSYKGDAFDKLRPELGLQYALNKKNEFTLYYLIDKAFNESDPLTLYVLGLNYTLKL